jgi:hypothetical protein
MKAVGKRKPKQGLEANREWLRTVAKLRGDRPFIPKGVYRFDSFEEAQAWHFKMITRKEKQKT